MPSLRTSRRWVILEIEFGNREGRYFTQWRFDDLARLAGDLEQVVSGITGFKVWYNEPDDFHVLEFDLEGHHYQVDYYMVFTLMRDGNQSYLGSYGRKVFGRKTWGLVSFFAHEKYRTWGSSS